MQIGPACPACHQRVPLARTQWNLGASFSCTGCNRTIVVSKSNAFVLGFGLFLTFWAFRDRFPDSLGGAWGLFAVIVVLGLPLTWALTRARLP